MMRRFAARVAYGLAALGLCLVGACQQKMASQPYYAPLRPGPLSAALSGRMFTMQPPPVQPGTTTTTVAGAAGATTSTTIAKAGP